MTEGTRVLKSLGQVVASGGTVVLENINGNGGYRPADVSVLATLDGWALPAVWSAGPAPVSVCEVIDAAGNPVSGSTCSLSFSGDLDGSDAVWQVPVTVSTTSVTPVRWRATIDFADLTKFPFLAPYVYDYSGNSVVVAPGVTCSSTSRVVSLTGRSDWGLETVQAGTTRTVDLNGRTAPIVASVVYGCP